MNEWLWPVVIIAAYFILMRCRNSEGVATRKRQVEVSIIFSRLAEPKLTWTLNESPELEVLLARRNSF